MAAGHMFPMRGYAIPAIAQMNKASYQAGFILSTYELPEDPAVRRYIERTTEADAAWKSRHRKLGGTQDMLSCAQAGGSWGNNFSSRRRQGTLNENDAKQLALVSKFGLCCPDDQALDTALPTSSDEWFSERNLPLSLELRVGFLQPAMHAALNLPHATALLPPDMRRGFGTLLTGQATAQEALRAAYVEVFFTRAPAPKRRRGW